MPINRVEFLGVGFDLVTMADMLERMAKVDHDTPYAFVVTPNVDHVVRLNEPEGRPYRALYDKADYSLCDSRILRQLGRAHGLDLPLVAGSDLTAKILEHVVTSGDRIAVVGGDPTLVADLRRRHPGVTFLHHEPPMGLRRDGAARAAAARFIADARARFTFIAVGSPQQEMIAGEVSALPAATGVALCIGASLDFITGRQSRAPELMQRLSLEWAYRLLSDPKRMWRRYLVEGPRIFLLAARFRKDGIRP